MSRRDLLGAVDRSADRPPYRQIADQLRGLITSGAIPPDGKLPSEAELITHYGVARMTARRAIDELRAEGLVVSEQGRGVFVRQPRRPAVEAVARFLRLNYVPGTSNVPWDEASPGEREAWLCEAGHVVDLVLGRPTDGPK